MPVLYLARMGHKPNMDAIQLGKAFDLKDTIGRAKSITCNGLMTPLAPHL